MISFVKSGLTDVSFSRPKDKVEWGIPVPGDDSQLIYVWADALTNYISAIGYGRNDISSYWPADVHFIGKDISKFHLLIWPAILMSLGLDLPKNIFVHGFITVNGQKMSKSLGNVIDPFELIQKYGVDALRYYFLREITPTEDGDFSYLKFQERYNSDLVSGLGNLVARVNAMAKNINTNGFIADNDIVNIATKVKNQRDKAMESFKFNIALSSIWELISFSDKYIEENKPWEKDAKNKEQVIFNLLFLINNIGELIAPFMPETSAKILNKYDGHLFERIC
jgi:methionyl-tRNA synthetase